MGARPYKQAFKHKTDTSCRGRTRRKGPVAGDRTFLHIDASAATSDNVSRGGAPEPCRHWSFGCHRSREGSRIACANRERCAFTIPKLIASLLSKGCVLGWEGSSRRGAIYPPMCAWPSRARRCSSEIHLPSSRRRRSLCGPQCADSCARPPTRRSNFEQCLPELPKVVGRRGKCGRILPS